MEEEDRYTRITLRIPKDLHRELQASAGETSKSMNAEIVARLQSTFGPRVVESEFHIGGKSAAGLFGDLDELSSNIADQVIKKINPKLLAEALRSYTPKK